MKQAIKPVLIIALVFTLLFVITVPLSAESYNLLTVHFINVGQGDSILIQVNGKNMLIDAGPKNSSKTLLNYLNSQNIAKLDYVIATHPHEDHIGGMSFVINKYSINKFYAPKVTQSTKIFEQMIESLQNKNLSIIPINASTASIDLGPNTKTTIYSPVSTSYDNLNNYSPVIKLTYFNNSFLFTGDAAFESEKEILQKNSDINADVIKIGHHGSATSTAADFLKAVNPKIAVISVGKNNDYGHPASEILSLLKRNKIKIYRTDLDGTIVMSSDGTKISIKKNYRLQ